MEKTNSMNDYKSKLYLLKETDPYIILGVKNDASIEEINKQYKDLAKNFHPDLHSKLNDVEKSELTQIFSKITAAFNLLKDSEERKKYDYEKQMKLEREKYLNNPNNISIVLNPQKQTTTISNTQPGINLGNLFKEVRSESREIKKQKAESLFEKGLSKYKSNNIEGAITDFQSAIEIESRVAKYHSNLGLAMKSKGWNGYALAEFKIAINFDPNDKIALANINILNQQQKNISEVVKEKSNNGILDRVKNLFKKS